MVNPDIDSNKEELFYIAKKIFGKTFKDPTNTNEKFLRTNIRNLKRILEEKNEIYLSKYSGWYSVSDEAFYTEDEIEEVDVDEDNEE